MTILLFIFILSILILVHEAGHFFAAKKLGVRVDAFSLGFGKKLFSRIHDGTEYRICAIPLGGYVQMAGDERGKTEGKMDEYLSKPAGHRALIVLMGPLVNYVFAYICFVAVFIIGFLHMDEAMKDLPAKIGTVVSGTAAERAGLFEGDLVLEVDGHKITNWAAMTDDIIASEGKTMSFLVERGGKDLTISVTPEIQKEKDLFGRGKPISRIGVKPAGAKINDEKHVERYGLWGAMKRAAVELGSVTGQTYTALGKIIAGNKEAREGMTSIIGIFFIIKFAAGLGIAFLIHIVAIVSASLAIFNLLPLIPLDGGHLLLIALEKMRGQTLSLKTEEIVSKAGLSFILALAAFVFYLDIQRMGWIEKITGIFIR